MTDIDTAAANSHSLAEHLLARAIEEAASIGSIPPHENVTVPKVARHWLEEGPRRGDRQGALEALLGARALADYDAAIGAVRRPLAAALEAAAHLPATRTASGLVVPAGTGLHRLCGSPSRVVATWRRYSHGCRSETERDALRTYPIALAATGYASADALQAGLPGALLLGLLLELPGALGTDVDAAVDAATDRDAVRALFSAVLDLGDTLALSMPDEVSRIASAHVASRRSHRARRLLATHLERVPDDAEAALAHARLRLERDRGIRPGRATRDALVRAMELAPDEASLAFELARVERERGDPLAARSVLERVRARQPDAPGLARAFALVERLRAWHDAASRPDAMPEVTPDADERREGCFRVDTLEAAAALYERHGTLAVSDAFDPTLLEACREQFVAAHGEQVADSVAAGSLNIGDRRFQVSLEIGGAFNTPDFYANGFVLPLLRRLLDEQAIVGSAVCATSLPGAKAQHLHKDHRAPFTRDAEDEPMRLPSVAVTVMIPLVPLDGTVGSTEVRKGSHRRSAAASARLPSQYPLLGLGGFFLMDLALSHAGQANRSERVRPIVNMQYTRRWFVDNKNFHKQRPLAIAADEWARVPREHRKLFDWATRPQARVGR